MSIRRLIALMLIAAGIASLALSINSGSQAFQYLVLPPAMQAAADEQPAQADTQEKAPGETQGESSEAQTRPAQADAKPKLTALEQLLKQLRERMAELTTAVAGYGITSYRTGAQLSTPQQGSAIATVQGLWGNVSLAERYVLSAGRQLYHEELELGTPSAVIDERLAIELFRVGDPIGRTFSLSGASFRVVGVVRHRRHVGEKDQALAQVPLLSLDKQGVPPEVMAVNVLPKAGSGAYAALSKDLTQWQAGGSFHSLPKERYRAMLPLRFLLCGLGLMVAALALKAAKAFSLSQWYGLKSKLEARYALPMTAEIAGRMLLVILCYGVILTGIFLVLQQAIAPVYMFPEWVPTVLVEPKDIAKAFWGVREQQSALITLNTPELLRLRFLHRLMTALCGAAALLLISPMGKLRSRIGGR